MLRRSLVALAAAALAAPLTAAAQAAWPSRPVKIVVPTGPGSSLDLIVRTPEGLRFARRECIYDSELIPNSIIYPI